MQNKNIPQSSNNLYMGTKEAAQKFGVTPATVSKWCRQGRFGSDAEQDAPGSPWRISQDAKRPKKF